jgi:hypothetical protein
MQTRWDSGSGSRTAIPVDPVDRAEGRADLPGALAGDAVGCGGEDEDRSDPHEEAAVLAGPRNDGEIEELHVAEVGSRSASPDLQPGPLGSGRGTRTHPQPRWAVTLTEVSTRAPSAAR